MTSFRKSAAFSIASAMAMLIGSAASAAAPGDVTVLGESPPGESLTARVSYADLNLAAETGVDRLSMRVRGAVREVCAPVDDRRTIFEHNFCKTYAWNGAKPQIDRAVLRAQQLAAYGTTAIAPAAIIISAPAF